MHFAFMLARLLRQHYHRAPNHTLHPQGVVPDPPKLVVPIVHILFPCASITESFIIQSHHHTQLSFHHLIMTHDDLLKHYI